MRHVLLQGIFGLAAAFAVAAAYSASGEVAQADAQRRKPLQRCDQLNDKAEIDCLHKARERIVEARRKREAAGKTEPPQAKGDVRATSGK